MKILVYGINYAPELTGIGKYTAEMAATLAGYGHDVRIVCAPPYYPQCFLFWCSTGARPFHFLVLGVAY